MFKDIKFDVIKDKENFLFIDVRSPSEYYESTIPNAINIPLFDDQERAMVGTVYKEQNPEIATKLGLQIVSPKIPKIIGDIRSSLKEGQTPIFFCWRGGMRSKTVATLYDLVYPANAYRLEGGYRAYREYIVEVINNTEIKLPTFVLHGMTGVGKTILLEKLKMKNFGVIDLEGLAGHRGSIFGGIGDVSPVNQKQFDSRFYDELLNLKKHDCLILEAESKRIGKITIPDNILNAKENGYHILVEASMETRINRIIAEYKPIENKEEIYKAFTKIAKRLPTDARQTIASAFETNNFHTIVKLFLIHYYDPRYQHSTEQYNGDFFQVNSNNLENAVMEIANYIKEIVKNKESLLV